MYATAREGKKIRSKAMEEDVLFLSTQRVRAVNVIYSFSVKTLR